MRTFRTILLDVWREACQHIEIAQSTAGIAPLLARHIPLDMVKVQRVEREHLLLATVATWRQAGHRPEVSSHECTPDEMRKLLDWIGTAMVAGPDHQKQLPSAIAVRSAAASSVDWRAIPLLTHDEPMGVLTVVARPGERFTQEHEAMVALLQEPLAVALENDRRLHEMAALREAAEADRRSLLRRLGRSDVHDRIVGEQRGLAQVMKRVDLVSVSDAPVLLLGETGTGKEVVARAIHNKSDRCERAFIRVNCGAIPPELIDSQLFGHEKGSFTGAGETRRGWFERADGGTLFLDEIGELPLDAQVRFLRVLQDSYIERVGGQNAIRVDVRVIAATNRDLTAMVRQGRFREDLWYRIAIFPILLPPLRERLDDIAELAAHFSERAAFRFGLAHVPPSQEDVRLLQTYSWPGNIRELAAVLDRAALLGEGRTLEIAAALGFSSHATAATTPPALPLVSTHSSGPAGRFTCLDDAIRRHIEAALHQTGGRVEGPRGAAALLQVNPHTLRARMRKLRIDWASFRSRDRE